MTTFAYVSIYLHMCKFAHMCKFGHENASTYVSNYTYICNSKLFACEGDHMQKQICLYVKVFYEYFRILQSISRHVYAQQICLHEQMIPKSVISPL